MNSLRISPHTTRSPLPATYTHTGLSSMRAAFWSNWEKSQQILYLLRHQTGPILARRVVRLLYPVVYESYSRNCLETAPPR
jgi:hypothetical protein